MIIDIKKDNKKQIIKIGSDKNIFFHPYDHFLEKNDETILCNFSLCSFGNPNSHWYKGRLLGSRRMPVQSCPC